ncbi:hypothetical protein [Entomobacter blattae]|uniref:Uncharacterized protein n=1 Tax=Entomobacter blattae TaxID=2762277 RepID=A0A7H1NTZ8_9PROT|nr:hypothetical protein [Entomobacter blattae]QNT79258.1 hypothetical protein JGUZn3_20530 [Entomobacter blattae]
MRVYMRSPVTLTRGNGERVHYAQGWCEIAREDEKNSYLMAFVDKVEVPVPQRKKLDPAPDNNPPNLDSGDPPPLSEDPPQPDGDDGGTEGEAGDNQEPPLGNKGQRGGKK